MSTSRLRLQKMMAFFTSSLTMRRRSASRLSIAADHGERLDHGRRRRGRRRHRDFLGVHQEGVGEAADLGRHRRREEQRLADSRQQPDDALDIGDEAHVEHAVGLVDHQDLDVREQDLAALEQIDEAPGRGDHHVDAAVELALLIGEALAADEQRLVELVVLAIDLEGVGDLGGELARRLEDERARHARPRPAGGEDVDHGKGEGGGLAGAGLGAAENVAPRQHVGDGLGLDGGGGGVTGVLDRPQDL